MTNIKKLTAIVVCMALMFTMMPAAALAEDSNIIFSEPFDGVPTNGASDKITVTGAKSRTIDIGYNNKAVQIVAGDAATVKVPFATSAKKYVISFDILGDSRINAKISLGAGNSDTVLLGIADNAVTTDKGKRAGSISSVAFSRVSVAINKKSGTYTLYINDEVALRDWKLPANSDFDSFSISRESKMTESIYLDNICVYEGEEPAQTLPKEAYSNEGMEFVDITDDLGDFSFFKSNYITHRYVAYPNTTFVDNKNEVICEKFDYTNAEKGDRIIFKKINDSDCYMNITAKIFTTYRSSKVYKYYKLSGDFMCDFDGEGSANIFFLRDNITTGSNIDVYAVRVNADGSLTLYNGTTVSGAATKGKWFNVTMYLNLADHTATMFVDGKKVLDNAKLNQEMENLALTRVQMRSGAYTGEMQCRNMEFTGLDKPYNGEEIWTSMFSEDTAIEDYLADKITFHYHAENMWYNGAKAPLTAKPVYEDGEMYVSAQDFNTAYGVTALFNGAKAALGDKEVALEKAPKQQGGTVLVPVMETAQKLLGYYTFDDTNGFIITSKNEIYFDASEEVPYHKRETITGYINRLSTLQYIYDYMMFERPDKEYLLEKFNQATDNGAQHPRILATAEDFDRIKALYKTDEYMKNIVDAIIKSADSYCAQEPIFYKFDDNLRTTTTGNRLRERMQVLGLAYQVTGEQKYVDCAWANLEALNRFPDINPGHPIDTGSYGVGIAIGYDWMYHAFTPEQRANIEENAKRLHLTVIHDGFYGRSPVRGGPDGNINVIGYYNKWISNYNIWVNGGSVMMAAAFMDVYPDMCSDLMENSIRSLEYAFKNLYPEGAWVESSNYWEIVANYMGYTFGTLDTIYGTDFNLSRFPGTERTGLVNLALRSMSKGVYNYHDASMAECYASYTLPFLGKYFNQPVLLAARYGTMTRAYDSRMKAQGAHVFDALYYEPGIDPMNIEQLPKVVTAEGLELFAVHRDYTDYDSLFFASHAGPVSFYHSHNDCGDFVLDLNGQRWAYSLPAEDYNSSLAGNERYRMRTEGHNTVTINNGTAFNQSANTYAPMIATDEGEGGAYAVYDMTELYPDVNDYKRGFYISDNFRTVTVRDEIDLNKDNSEIYWFMHTEAQCEVIDDRTVIMSQNGESLALNFETDAEDAAVTIMDAVPLFTSPEGKGQNPNLGIRKVAIRMVGSGKVNLTVRMAEMAGTVDTAPISEWTAPAKADTAADNADYGYSIAINGTTFDNLTYIPVIDTSAMPQIGIDPTDESMHAEIEMSDSLDKANIVRVYNSDRSRCKIYIVPYSTTLGVKEMAYDEIEIKDYSVTAEPQPENGSVNMFDNDFSTRWTTLNKGETAVFDIGSVQTIDGFAAGFWQSGVRTYNLDVYTSTDGVSWEFTGSVASEKAPEEYQIFKMPGTTARYIKVIGQGNSANINTNILEFRVLRLKETFR
ncbi:MAG: heparinase II/III family protein [Clostridia bacterium]|nr:heparinase II/III family protein [Clostridia bacterium]